MNETEPNRLAALFAKAETGDIEAQYELGWRHALGQGFELDDEAALRWLRRAADNGHVLAQNNLGARYVAGDGVPRDLVEAWRYFHLAAGQGDRKAGKNRDSIAAQMTPAEQIGRASCRERV